MQALLIILVWTAAVVAALFVVFRRLGERQHSLQRLLTDDTAAATDSLDEQGYVARWLYLAGYRSADAPTWFYAAMLLSLLLAALIVFAAYRMKLVAQGVAMVSEIPGGIGEVFTPVVHCIPWFVGIGVFLLPVGAWDRRRKRVEQVEQDLPLALELLATLSEAGLSFDSALARIIEADWQTGLAGEFRSFQSDLMAGRSRVDALRRLARRMEVSTMTILVSALVQAEQLGTGIAQVIRRQADDLGQRRRERANAFAASLAVKRMFPLVLCFLPGLFVWTLGPVFTQLFKMADAMMRTRGL